jgi:hypothetical protein
MTGISYNTLRADLKTFERMELLCIHRSKNGKKIRFKSLLKHSDPTYLRFLRLFKKYNKTAAGRNPENTKGSSMWFADLVTRKNIENIFLSQAFAIAAKDERYHDTTFRTILGKHRPTIQWGKYTKTHVSLDTIARHLGRSKTTVFKYLNRLQDNDLIQMKKSDRQICTVSEWNSNFQEAYRNRTYNNGEFVLERLANEYVFPKIGKKDLHSSAEKHVIKNGESSVKKKVALLYEKMKNEI